MKKTMMIAGCVLWIAGLILSIVGMNLTGTAGRWTAVIGNILFLVGLGIVGALWLRNRMTREDGDSKDESKNSSGGNAADSEP